MQFMNLEDKYDKYYDSSYVVVGALACTGRSSPMVEFSPESCQWI